MNKAAAAALLLVLSSSAARPDDAADLKAEAASRVESARGKLARGGYFDAIVDLKKAVAADPASVDAAMMLAVAYRDTGEYRKAADLLVPFDKSPAALTLRAELLLAVGDDAGADATAKAALALDANALGALVVAGRVQEGNGDREGAIKTYTETNHRWVAIPDEQETDDLLLAEARAELGVFRLSNDFKKDTNRIIDRLKPVLRRSPDRLDAVVEIADLYLATYQDVDAKTWYGKALDRNPHYAPALFGKAQQMAFRYEEVDAAKLCEDQVLRENPNYVPALLFLAQQALGDGDVKKAAPLVGKALVVNPKDVETRATHAAMSYLSGDVPAYDAETKEVLARNKFASPMYSVLGRALEEQRRFDEALIFAEKAVAADPLDWNSYFLAGRNALNVGEDAKGEKYLNEAERKDAFHNIYRTNFLMLFEKMRNFAVRKDATFVVRMAPEEEEPFFRLLKKAMDESIGSLAKKWGVAVQLPVHVSVFSQQEDFATRTIGLPGFPALGACFGQVVTLDSPRVGPPGMFLWNAVQHHELAHVITLQLSKGRVPRWLTEGASVYEERHASKSWSREDERTLIDAIASDEVLTLKDVNAAFRGPRVMYAYYQGGLMCEFIDSTFGFDKLREMVRLYGEGLSDGEVVKKTLGIEATTFDARFLQYAKDFVKDLHVFRRPTKAKMDKLKREMRKKPDDAEGWILLCEGALGQKDNASALSALANAAKLLPDDARIPALRAMTAWRENRPETAVKHAEEALAKGADYFELRMGLAEFYAQPGKDTETAKTHWKRAIELYPVQNGPRDPRLLLANVLTAEGEKNLDEVMALMRAHADVDEEDIGTRMSLATMYAQHGKGDDELHVLEEVRDIVPLPNAKWKRASAVALHERLAEMYGQRKRNEDAELAWSCAVGCARMQLVKKDGGAEDIKPLEPSAVADLVARHGESLLLLGRTDEAKARADEALRLDPSNETAKKLLESLTR